MISIIIGLLITIITGIAAVIIFILAQHKEEIWEESYEWEERYREIE
jgi:hypothetical protein